MSSVKNPSDKKRNELRADHRTAMEAPHAFRKNWPKKKALVNRRYRRRAQAELQDVRSGADPDTLSVEPRLRTLSKSGTTTLSEAVKENLSARISWTGAQYTLKPYSRLAGEKSRVCVASLIKGRKGRAVEYCRCLLSMMDDQHVPTSTPWHQQRWMRRFTRDFPSVEGSIREWASKLKVGEGRPTTS